MTAVHRFVYCSRPTIDGAHGGSQNTRMTSFRDLRSVRIWITVFYALSMAVLGFGHAGQSPASVANNVDLAVYALPDGSLPTVCLIEKEGGIPHLAGQVCDACLLTASPGLLPCADAAEQYSARATIPAPIAPADRTVVFEHAGHVPHLRGPPTA